MTDLHQLSAVELAGVIAAKQVSIPEVAPGTSSIVRPLPMTSAPSRRSPGSTLIALAEQAQRRLDERDAGPLPRLFGVPTAIKDLDATRGIRTTFGSALFRDFVPDADDEIVEAIREGGSDRYRQDDGARVRGSVLHRAGSCSARAQSVRSHTKCCR